MTKEEIENFFKDGGYLDGLMKKYLFLNLPPKIGYGKNTLIDIDFNNGGIPTPEAGIDYELDVYGKVYTMRDKDGRIFIWYTAYPIKSSKYTTKWLYKQEYDTVNKRLKSPVRVELPGLASENIKSIEDIGSKVIIVLIRIHIEICPTR